MVLDFEQEEHNYTKPWLLGRLCYILLLAEHAFWSCLSDC